MKHHTGRVQRRNAKFTYAMATGLDIEKHRIRLQQAVDSLACIQEEKGTVAEQGINDDLQCRVIFGTEKYHAEIMKLTPYLPAVVQGYVFQDGDFSIEKMQVFLDILDSALQKVAQENSETLVTASYHYSQYLDAMTVCALELIGEHCSTLNQKINFQPWSKTQAGKGVGHIALSSSHSKQLLRCAFTLRTLSAKLKVLSKNSDSKSVSACVDWANQIDELLLRSYVTQICNTDLRPRPINAIAKRATLATKNNPSDKRPAKTDRNQQSTWQARQSDKICFALEALEGKDSTGEKISKEKILSAFNNVLRTADAEVRLAIYENLSRSMEQKHEVLSVLKIHLYEICIKLPSFIKIISSMTLKQFEGFEENFADPYYSDAIRQAYKKEGLRRMMEDIKKNLELVLSAAQSESVYTTERSSCLEVHAILWGVVWNTAQERYGASEALLDKLIAEKLGRMDEGLRSKIEEGLTLAKNRTGDPDGCYLKILSLVQRANQPA